MGSQLTHLAYRAPLVVGYLLGRSPHDRISRLGVSIYGADVSFCVTVQVGMVLAARGSRYRLYHVVLDK